MSTDPRIEAAARALYASVNKPHAERFGWDEVKPRWQESYRSDATAAVAAADKAATITTVAELDALPAGSRAVIADLLMQRMPEMVDETFWQDCGTGSPVDVDDIRDCLENLSHARVIHWGAE